MPAPAASPPARPPGNARADTTAHRARPDVSAGAARTITAGSRTRGAGGRVLHVGITATEQHPKHADDQRENEHGRPWEARLCGGRVHAVGPLARRSHAHTQLGFQSTYRRGFSLGRPGAISSARLSSERASASLPSLSRRAPTGRSAPSRCPDDRAALDSSSAVLDRGDRTRPPRRSDAPSGRRPHAQGHWKPRKSRR